MSPCTPLAIAHRFLVRRILLAAVAIFSLYSVHLLLKTANEGGECGFNVPVRMSAVFSEGLSVSSLRKGALVYEQLGYKAFGIPGKLAASCSITMQNIGGETSERFFVCLFIDLSSWGKNCVCSFLLVPSEGIE